MLRYFRDKTQSEVAQILNVSQVQVSRLENRILAKMKNKLKKFWNYMLPDTIQKQILQFTTS